MNEPKVNPMLSYDKEKKKPILLNDEAVYLCVDFINDPSKEMGEGVHFEVDDLFLEWMQGMNQNPFNVEFNPSPEQIDTFVLKMVQECSELDEEELPTLGEVLKEKMGLNDEESDKDKKTAMHRPTNSLTDIPWYDGDL